MGKTKKVLLTIFTLLIILCVPVLLYPQGPYLEWAKSMTGSLVNQGFGIALQGGYVHITGSFSDKVDFDPGPGVYELTPVGGREIFVAKLDVSGNFVWAVKMGGAAGWDQGFGIAVDGSGNVYTTGVFE